MCDNLLDQSKQLGYRIIGSLFWTYIPDASPPPLKAHKEWIKNRKDLYLKQETKLENY